ncbi:MAG: LemA family protein [Bacteroidota bacterium]
MKSIVNLAIVVGLLLLLFIGGCNSYNGFVDADENVDQAWSDVQAQYQRRADLIPSLAKTVKAAAENEKEILTGVIDARTGASNFKELINKAKSPQELQGVGEKINSQINVIFERYPEIRSTNNYTTLQDQLEGTENRITVHRQKYNAAATKYNKKVRRFPGTVFASIFGFQERDQFEAQAGSETMPDLNELN